MSKIIITTMLLFLAIATSYGQAATLTEQEKLDLRYLYEEERLANDVYKQLAKKWNSRVFSQIAISEERHYFYLMDLLEKYNMPIPKNEVGFYNSAVLNSIYDNFMSHGMSSYMSALQVAAQFEEYDIVDLQEASERAEKPAIKRVYQYLINGSKNHLRALYRNIKRKNGSYEPVLLGKVEFMEIVNKDKNRKRKSDVYNK